MIDNIAQAAEVICTGGILLHPTEAVWGLGCDPMNEAAVKRLCAMKQRAIAKGVIVLVSDIQLCQQWSLPLTDTQWARIQESWPGHVTWCFPASDQVPLWIRGQHDTVALRQTAHPLLQQLLSQCGGMMVSTSANIAGESPPRQQQACYQLPFFADCELMHGDCLGAAGPSSIMHAETLSQYR